ncbi:MAG: hypothetical protein CL623_06320 [Arcobacter sp.]|nr:hypothetical protein [Arcobacter sp.]|tara:strand:- start:5264 stop:6613 length:1350 start_codon:yes stop_codon:yes gene_type:complete
MKNLKYNIKNTICVNFTLPFWLDKVFIIKNQDDRQKTLNDLVKLMNTNNDNTITLEDYANIRTLEKRKESFIQIKVPSIDILEKKVKEIFQVNYNSLIINCNYIDYGAGYINIKVYCKLNTDIKVFFTQAELMKTFIAESIVKYAKYSNDDSFFDKFDEVLKNLKNNIIAFNKIDIYNNYFYHGNLKKWMCGPISRDIIFFTPDYHKNILKSSVKEENNNLKHNIIEIDLAIFKENTNFFLGGIKFFREMETGYLPYIYHSFEGTVAIVENSKFNRLNILQCIAMFYWTIFYSAASGTYLKSSQYLKKEEKLTDINIKNEIRKLENSRRLLQLLKFESKPENVIVEGIDSSIYSLIFSAYESDKLEKSLDDMEHTLDQNLDSLLFEIESIKEEKIQNVLSLITIATISSLIMDMYLFYDQLNNIGIVFSIIFLPIIVLGLGIYFYVYKK